MNSYKTLKEYGEKEIVIKKSRFIGKAMPVETPEEAIEFINGLRKKYPDATHHCYAYIIGENSGIMRYSDDGEPGGTAGIPMMEVLKMRQIVNAVVVVTRYFGGVMLGAGGLVRAYTQGCVEALTAAKVAVMEKSLCLSIKVPYGLWDKVQYEMGKEPVEMVEVLYEAQVTCRFHIRQKDFAAFEAALALWSDGSLNAEVEDEKYLPWPEELVEEIL